jgi:hypothetical protein
MNERIQALATEAGFYSNPDIEKFQKFAELIISECANLVDGYVNERTRYWAGVTIRQHFHHDDEQTN